MTPPSKDRALPADPQSRKRGAGLSRLAYEHGRSAEAERMWERRTEVAFYRLLAQYRHRGNRGALLRALHRVRTEVDTGPTLPVDEALLAEGRQDRHQDEARELCLRHGATVDELKLFIARTLREIDVKFGAIRAAEARLV